MAEDEPRRVQGLTVEVDTSSFPIRIHVQPLANQIVPVQSRLQANLVPLARYEADLDERGIAELLQHPVPADRLRAFRFSRVRGFLKQQPGIPGNPIAPRSLSWRELTMHDREVHALRFMSSELILQPQLHVSSLREHDETRRIAIDSMYDEGAALSARTQVFNEFVFDRRRVAAAGQRNAQ